MKRVNHSMRSLGVVSAFVLSFAAMMFAALQADTAATKNGGRRPKAKTAAETPREVKIDLNKAVEVKLPAMPHDLRPVNFKTTSGKQGWSVKIPGGRPIATPAYADGMLFVGGGYGSHEFYAFNAETGALVWKIKTSDDGPTAAVVEGGYVAFNTESCTLIVVEAKTGKLVWQEWLGDPLMSQPAIADGRVYIAYPAGQRGGGHTQQQIKPHNIVPHQGQANAAHANVQQSAAPTEVGSHRLLAADLKTGKHIWEQTITGDVISAPVVSGDKIYFTCFDGTSFSLNASNGSVAWKKANAGTSAPVVVGDQVILTQKEQKDNKAYEGMKRLDARRGDDNHAGLLGSERAEYLAENKGGGVAMSNETQAALDSSVGFSTAPSAAKLDAANKHIGVKTVAGGWAYQGSRAAYSRGRMLNAQGRFLNSINASDGRFAWRAEVSGRDVDADGQVFSPPALGEQYMYLSSSLGHLISVRQNDGEVGFVYSFKQPMTFQPALARGNIYVGTSNGLLVCLKTGDRDADGWYAWGGNAQHNKNK